MKKFRPRRLIIGISITVLICVLGITVVVPQLMNAFSYNPQVDYPSILASSPGYGVEQEPLLFSYDSADTPGLTALRTQFNLAAIAGQGTDFEKSQRILQWVHQLIPHDGNCALPAAHDAITLITTSLSKKQGLNCRGLAIVFSEALLSLGIKARFVELLPRDFSTEIHVVSAVYLRELSRWVFIDPSYQLWLLDNQGQIMDFMAIRAALSTKTALQLNAESNYNGGALDLDYLHYLSKNFYRFASPIHAGFGMDSSDQRLMVILNPQQDMSTRRNPFESLIQCHDPDRFWQAPN